jgi:hypothetical protein
LGWLWPCPQILRPDWKGFPMANPLGYWASSSVTKEKSFITLTPGNLMFVTVNHFHTSLIIEGKDWSLPLEWSFVRATFHQVKSESTGHENRLVAQN